MKQLILASLLFAMLPSARGLTLAGATLPDHATVAGEPLFLNGAGKRKGTIEGDDFHRALMRIWLGASPVSADLRKVLLGG